MQTEEFITRVSKSLEVSDEDLARKITLATIEALCLHLSQEEIRRMASQLPEELSKAAITGGHQQTGDPESRVELEQFYHEVAVRAEMPEDNVVGPARVVIDVFAKAISRGEFADVVFDLPPELNTIVAN